LSRRGWSFGTADVAAGNNEQEQDDGCTEEGVATREREGLDVV